LSKVVSATVVFFEDVTFLLLPAGGELSLDQQLVVPLFEPARCGVDHGQAHEVKTYKVYT
jgi:hypothetical protein